MGEARANYSNTTSSVEVGMPFKIGYPDLFDDLKLGIKYDCAIGKASDFVDEARECRQAINVRRLVSSGRTVMRHSLCQ